MSEQVMSVWRVFKVLTDHGVCSPLIVETFVAEFGTSAEAIQHARLFYGERMLVRETEGKPAPAKRVKPPPTPRHHPGRPIG